MKSLYDIEIENKLQQHYKIKTVAKLFEISEKTIRRWIREGKLQVVKIGGSIRIPRNEIVKFVESIN